MGAEWGEFIEKVFFPALRDKGAMVVGFNLPYDLARCAVGWTKGEDDEWSLIMSQYPDGNENKNFPRILVEPIDSKKAFVRLAIPWNINQKKKQRLKWKSCGQVAFLDLRTLLWALYNKSYSLKRACDNQDGPFKGWNLPQKIDDQPTGKVTPEEIEYARQDARCTVGLLNALKQEFDRHPVALKPSSAYSPASVAKAYLAALGIVPPAEKFNIQPEAQGIAMQSYFGGRLRNKDTLR